MFFLLLNNYVHAQDLSQYGWKKGIKINGGLNFNSVNYASNGIANRRDPFNWFASGNLNMNLFGYSLPFSFSLSNAARTYTQPFNRIQFRPSYKWIKGYWGNTSMSFSPLTLSGHLFNGYGIDLSKGKWNFAAMYGRLREAVAYDPIAKNFSSTSFKRKGMGFKAGYRFKSGNELNLIFFTAKDDIQSLAFVPLEAQLVPKQNYVASIGGKKKFFKKFNVQLEYALSGIITDKSAIENGTVNRAQNFLNFILPNKPNAKFYDAIKGSFGYNAKKYGIQLQYERITPEYQTLGAYFFNTDMENYTIAPNLNLLKGKMSINGNMGVQRNNLDKSKNSSTKRWVGNMNIAYNPGEKWNYSVAYNNFTTFTNIRPQNDPFFQNQLDSLNFYQVNNSFNANINHQFGSKEVKKSISFNTSYQKASDQQPGTQNGVQISDFITGNLAYTHTLAKKGINISGSANYSLNNAPNTKVVFFGPNINLSAPLYKKLIRSSAGVSYNKNISNGIKNSAVISARASFSYAPKAKKSSAAPVGPKQITDNGKTENKETVKAKTATGKLVQVQNPWKGKQSLSLNINYMNRLPALNVPVPFSELTVTFNWSYSF